MDQTPDRTAFLWNVHSYVNEYIRFTDTKAELVIGWTSAVAGALLAARFQDGFTTSFTGVLSFAGFMCLIAAFACAFHAVFPRLVTTNLAGFTFWRSILAHKSKEVFLARVSEQNTPQLEREVAGHIWDLSHVCDAKFACVNRSIVLAFVGSVLCGLMYLLK
jgi:hypothetical protein